MMALVHDNEKKRLRYTKDDERPSLDFRAIFKMKGNTRSSYKKNIIVINQITCESPEVCTVLLDE